MKITILARGGSLGGSCLPPVGAFGRSRVPREASLDRVGFLTGFRGCECMRVYASVCEYGEGGVLIINQSKSPEHSMWHSNTPLRATRARWRIYRLVAPSPNHTEYYGSKDQCIRTCFLYLWACFFVQNAPNLVPNRYEMRPESVLRPLCALRRGPRGSKTYFL